MAFRRHSRDSVNIFSVAYRTRTSCGIARAGVATIAVTRVLLVQKLPLEMHGAQRTMSNSRSGGTAVNIGSTRIAVSIAASGVAALVIRSRSHGAVSAPVTGATETRATPSGWMPGKTSQSRRVTFLGKPVRIRDMASVRGFTPTESTASAVGNLVA